jgi:hypothetical protein
MDFPGPVAVPVKPRMGLYALRGFCYAPRAARLLCIHAALRSGGLAQTGREHPKDAPVSPYFFLLGSSPALT